MVKKFRRTSRASQVSMLAILGLLGISFAQPASATIPAVQNVAVFSIGGSTYLNITVQHTPEIQSHYVDTIEVILGSNTTDLTIGVQQLNPDDTFTITYVVGPAPSAPTVTVRAHCTVNGWSDTNWTGTIPGLPTTPLALLFGALAPLAMILLRKGDTAIEK